MERLGIEPLSVFGLPPVDFVNLAADLGLGYIGITLSAMPERTARVSAVLAPGRSGAAARDARRVA